MSLLTAREIASYITNYQPPLIEGYIDFARQIQPAGFDVTLKEIRTPKEIRPYRLEEAKKIFLEGDVWPFEQPMQTLRPYILITNETVHLPLNVTGDCRVRSSITRLGSTLGSGIIDAGYNGPLTFSLITSTGLTLNQNDAIAQVIFHEHKATFPYHGQYQQVKKK